MSLVDYILRSKKPTIWRKFRALGRREMPLVGSMPGTPEEALERGYRLGLQVGYGEGLLDGVDLGIDVGMYAAYTPVVSYPEPVDIC